MAAARSNSEANFITPTEQNENLLLPLGVPQFISVAPQPPQWQAPPDNLALADDEAHIWAMSLKNSNAIAHALQMILAPDETERVERFAARSLRDRYITGRGTLRLLLSQYTHTPPQQLRFIYNQYGKPDLLEPDGSSITFNLSHSGEWLLCAIAKQRKIGIDIEQLRFDYPVEKIALRFFSPYENQQLLQLPNPLKTLAFFTCWSRKEAYIKGRGVGLSLPLDQFRVSLIPGELNIRVISDSLDETENWTLQTISPCMGYIGAVASTGNDWHLKPFLIDEKHNLFTAYFPEDRKHDRHPIETTGRCIG